MNILALDTSGPVLAVAASSRDGLVAEMNVAGALKHSENLLFLIDSVLHTLGLKLASVDLFACGLGPGSFTGLRIGLATLKGLKLVYDKPCYGFSSLDLIAENVVLQKGRLGVLVDAKREKIYASFYRFQAGKRVKESEDGVFSFEEVLNKARGRFHLTGDALVSYGERLKENLPGATFLQEKFWFPRGNSFIQLAESRYKEMKSLSLEQIQPRYLRLSEAEEKRRRLEKANVLVPDSRSTIANDRTLPLDRGRHLSHSSQPQSP